MKPNHIQFFEEPRSPIPGNILFNALTPPREIILAVNPRLTIEVIEGVLKAAKDTENIVILELALSEMNLKGGYTGLTPKTFAERVRKAAENVGWFGYTLHADHVVVKKGTDEEIDNVKRELDARIDAGFTSYAIDTSYLFDLTKDKVSEQLKRVIERGLELFRYLDERIGHRNYGREGEVGEIGKSELTEVDEALFYIKSMKENGVDIHWLAINNGSKHGVSVDAQGNIIPQLGINLKRTVEIVQALWDHGYPTRIAQHGVSGTPLHLIAEIFPKGMIHKGNVATYYMLTVFDILRIYEPELFQRIYRWLLEKYGKEGVPEIEIFVENCKHAIKEFFYDLEKIKDDTREAIRARAYADTLLHLKAFGMEKTAEKVYLYLQKRNIKYD
ncbi:MAG: class II D-tagatose-bisphosphate aldolase, non-catalytic subunit [Aigarchaeota archaeon]|nr:class II D-tagatose-bisphosphate aldolase, non-catalytic subunit [Aigarchaeota archaeon]MCX8193657.1 class II D-tagatose-bisphosphate aldolase, non-catalytic subunit [Nitrososphaeria archaeon]